MGLVFSEGFEGVTLPNCLKVSFALRFFYSSNKDVSQNYYTSIHFSLTTAKTVLS